MTSLSADVCARLRHMTKTAKMWGSPQELECAAMHFTHLALAAKSPSWSLEQTVEFWRGCGAPFADESDSAEHDAMRSRMWGEHEAEAVGQVVQGYAVVWATLERHPEREAHATPLIEALLDSPQLAKSPDRLNMVLFAVMGFVAKDAVRFVEALNAERLRIGGHELRPLPIVAPFGPSDAGLTYVRKFTTWERVIAGITGVLTHLEAPTV